MRTKGTITSWDNDKGFGFIAPSTGGKDVFVHIKAFTNRNLPLKVNQLVTYELSSDKQGRTCAKEVALSGVRRPSRKKNSSIAIIGAILFFTFVGLSVVFLKIPLLIIIIYFVASLITYILYAVDKSAAKKGAWRTKENTLHLFSLIGGWPGAMIAQQQLRHKSSKLSFQRLYWLTVLVNLSAFIWLFTPTGTARLQSFFPPNETSQISLSLAESESKNFLIKAENTVRNLFTSIMPEKDVRVYKWQDENGNWHYSEKAPTSDNNVKKISTLKVNTSTNVIPSP